MTSSDILRRAASLICGAGAYSRHADGAACVAWTRRWSATGALERAARSLRSGAWMLGESSPALVDAKAAVCRVVGFPHVDAWEHAERPDWQRVRDVFREAA